MEITGIASQFAMQSRPICDALAKYVANIATYYRATARARYYFSRLHLVSSDYPGYPRRVPARRVPITNRQRFLHYPAWSKG